MDWGPERSDVYVISDLHIGGDEQMGRIDYHDELVTFLSDLEAAGEDTELLINGDAFGLWEYTDLHGVEAFDTLVETYPEVFEQLRRTGDAITITVLPGNHDHDLAAYDGFVERFAAFNINLEQQPATTRRVGDAVVWFEHGNQQDPNNRFDDFGNPYERPLGYYYNTHVVSRAEHLASEGQFDWLSDVQAVSPTERMPSWMLSKYVYREMHPLLRYSLIPFLLLFNISVLLAIVVALDLFGIWSTPVETAVGFLRQFGVAGRAAYVVLGVNIIIAGLLALVAVPLSLIVRDVRGTFERFDVIEEDLTVDPEQPYHHSAAAVMEDQPAVSVFCYGHTHRPLIERTDAGVIANSGTWLKRLHRREVIAGLLPPVYYPSYQLGYLHINEVTDGVRVSYVPIEKPSPISEDLTWTERLLVVGREPEPTVPDPVVVET